MSKTAKSGTGCPAKRLLDADLALRAAADVFGNADNDEDPDNLELLRVAAREFGDAWRATGAK